MSPYLLTSGVQGGRPWSNYFVPTLRPTQPGRRHRWLANDSAMVAGAARGGRALAVAGLFALAVLGTSAAAAQTVRGLVIGIDAYDELNDLAGAVNDARDVAGALAGAGVDDLVVLEDRAATRARVTAEWGALVARSEPGDTLVLTYAGHGGQEPARVAGSELDGLDESLLLGGFRSSGPGTRERILDDELNQWFAEAGERGLRVVFVADSCHAGTLTRSVDPRAPVTAVRTARYTISDDMLALDMPEDAADLDEADLNHVSFLAAGQEHEQVPEVALPGAQGRPEPRGALSYMFARAVEGKADADGDGVLQRSELWRFVRENVRMVSEARQTPNLLPNERGSEAVLRLGRSAAPSAEAAPLRLAVLNAEAGILGAVRAALAGVALVPVEDSPDLIWDTAYSEVVTAMGDVAAYDIDLAGLSAVVDKWGAVRAIRALSAGASLRLRVHPHDGLHWRGSVIAVAINGPEHPYLTVAALSGNGTVHYLYPLPSDPVRVASDEPFRLELAVTPPFGADHVVAMSAATPLDALNAALARLDGKLAAQSVAELMAGAAAEASGWRSGIQGLFTAP